jgi:hypothetical protein
MVAQRTEALLASTPTAISVSLNAPGKGWNFVLEPLPGFVSSGGYSRGAPVLSRIYLTKHVTWTVAEVTDGITVAGGNRGFAEFDTVDATWGGKPLEFPRIQGADVAGHIAAAGEGVSNSRIGERVITDGWLRDAKDPLNPEKATYLGSERDGGYAEYTTVPAENAHCVECDLSDVELRCALPPSKPSSTRIVISNGHSVSKAKYRMVARLSLAS